MAARILPKAPSEEPRRTALPRNTRQTRTTSLLGEVVSSPAKQRRALAARLGQRKREAPKAAPAADALAPSSMRAASPAMTRLADNGTTPTPGPFEVSLETREEVANAELDGPVSSIRRPKKPAGRIKRLLALFGVLTLILAGFAAYDGQLFNGSTKFLEVATKAKDFAATQAKAAGELLFKPRSENKAAASSAETQAGTPPKTTVTIRKEGHVPIPGGMLVFPEGFKPAEDGTYDLLIFFHGNTNVVHESANLTHLDAVVAMINLGVGSQVYEEYYNVRGVYEELLDSIQRGVQSRGLKNAQLGRVALCGWSAGYGAISSILTNRSGRDQLDAVLVFDGIHASFADEPGRLRRAQMKPFLEFAERASRGEVYFGISHSQIDPGAYAGSTFTANYLINAVGAERHPLDPTSNAPPFVELRSIKGVVSRKRQLQLIPTGEAKMGTFHVLGYTGDGKDDHSAHLFQMGATLLPELVARWGFAR